MSYKPNPIDTSDIKINKSLSNLTDELARNIHDIWALGRIEEGWTYGHERSDKKKTTPCLVEYSKLPDSEKEYDTNTAIGTLKIIVKLGYKIQKPSEQSVEKTKNSIENILSEINLITTKSINDIVSVWLKHDSNIWSKHPEIYLYFGEKVLSSGETLIAYDILTKGLESFKNVYFIKQVDSKQQATYLRLRQQQALSLAQSGALLQAQKSLIDLSQQGLDDGETLGILGRTYKDLAMVEKEKKLSEQYFESAFSIYHKSFIKAQKDNDLDSAYYNGINAATIALLSDNTEQAIDIATSVKNICIEILKTNRKDLYWVYATLGETELLFGNITESKKWYKKTKKSNQSNLRGFSSMQKQAKRILKKIGADIDSMNDCFNIPSIAYFSGNMPENSLKTSQQFSLEMEEKTRKQVEEKLDEMNIGIAYSSVSCCGDIIFLEELLKKGGEINVVLPFEKDKFLDNCDLIPKKKSWILRFEQILEKASQVKTLGFYNPEIIKSNIEFTNIFIYGSAKFRSQIMDTNVYGLTFLGKNIIEKEFKKLTTAIKYFDKKNSVQHFPFLPMMFADIKGYSKLDENQLINFSTFFLEKISQITKKFEQNIFSKRTQGDSLFFVFKKIQTAIDISIELQNCVSKTDWTQYGLPSDILFRISLDAGPCYSYVEPVTKTVEFCGNYVNRAARIEPITPPGSIYTSETFVALAKAMKVKNVQFNYAGQVILPKNSGIIPAFCVQQQIVQT